MPRQSRPAPSRYPRWSKERAEAFEKQLRYHNWKMAYEQKLREMDRMFDV